MASIWDDATVAQYNHADEQNQLRCRLLTRMVDTHPPPEKMPETYDAWVSDERLAYFAVFAVLTYEMKRMWALHAGKGPYYCQRCEEPQDGWNKLLCWECAWPGKIRDKAIEMARLWHSTAAKPEAVSA